MLHVDVVHDVDRIGLRHAHIAGRRWRGTPRGQTPADAPRRSRAAEVGCARLWLRLLTASTAKSLMASPGKDEGREAIPGLEH